MHIIYLAGACRLTTRRKLRMHFSSFVTEMWHQILMKLIGDASKNCLFLDDLYIFPTALFLNEKVYAQAPLCCKENTYENVVAYIFVEKKKRSAEKLCEIMLKARIPTHSLVWLTVISDSEMLWYLIVIFKFHFCWTSTESASQLYSNILL